MSNFNSLSQNYFGLIALIVSLVALLTTVLQVLQQYYSSAEGYRRCAYSVMGLWSQGTRRQLRWKEFRIEVLFETPVIFLCPPTNKRGPITHREINFIDGTDDSYERTKVLGEKAQGAADERAMIGVHTADDERASWVNLLTVLQREEKESRAWDERKRKIPHTPPRIPLRAIKPPEYGMVVGLQRKTRSWDFMPASITKPYATSAICHLIEMAAMLGMYWKVFDQIVWNLRAEGNGFILTSTTVHGLGLMVVFSVTGKSEFEDRRVIPCDDVKQLAFGTVPNIFEDDDYLKKQKDAQSLDLVFGTQDEVTATLESLGCPSETLKRYGKDHKHIFSVTFEIIGMLGKVFRIRGSSFRMLPNPTADSWVKQVGRKASWKVARLMEVFQDKLSEFCQAEGFEPEHPLSIIKSKWKNISDLGCDDEDSLSIESREAIHDAVDDIDTYLLDLSQATVLSVLVAHLNHVLEVLENPNSPLNTIILANKEELLLNHYFHQIRNSVVGTLNSEGKPMSREDKEQRSTIWITLIFRMLCWLLLHDFNKADARIVPSGLKGSRMPIFIS